MTREKYNMTFTWNVTATVNIPDDVMLQMKEVLGAKNFNRTVTWMETIYIGGPKKLDHDSKWGSW